MGLILCTGIALDTSRQVQTPDFNSSHAQAQYKFNPIQDIIQGFEDIVHQDWITNQEQQKESSSTLVNHDEITRHDP